MSFEIDNILDYLLLFARVQGLILSAILLFSYWNRMSARFLGLLLFSFSTLAIGQTMWGIRIEEWDVFGYEIRDFRSNSFQIPISFYLFLGPSMYFFILAATNKNFEFNRSHFLHFIPGIIEEVIAIVLFVIALKYGENVLPFVNTYQEYWSYIGFASTLVYTFYSYKLLKDYEDWIRESYSDLNGITLKWLYNLIIAIGSGLTIWLGLTIIKIVSGVAWASSGSIIYLYLCITIYWMGYSGYNRIKHSIELNFKPRKKEKDKDDEQQEDFSKEIELILKLVEQDKVYLEPSLTIYHLADKASMSPKKLSRVLNEGLNKSFHDFINEYRVAEVKARLSGKEFQHLTFESIGYDSGFNSKSSFHSIFKKFTGKTPKEFKASLPS